MLIMVIDILKHVRCFPGLWDNQYNLIPKRRSPKMIGILIYIHMYDEIKWSFFVYSSDKENNNDL